jgi:hypothetical protein
MQFCSDSNQYLINSDKIKTFLEKQITLAYKAGQESRDKEFEKMIRKIVTIENFVRYKNNPIYTITDEVIDSMRFELLKALKENLSTPLTE